MAVLEGAVLPKGSWILVTGANGYVASHVVNQFLQLGYHARGTVRDATKHAWLTEYFSNKYPDVQFQLVEVKDLTDVAALTKAAEGELGMHTCVYRTCTVLVLTRCVLCKKAVLASPP